MKKVIFTEKATKPTAPYSQAIVAGNTVYLAGVCGDDPVTGELKMDSIEEESTYAMENLKATIEAAGGTMNDIVKVSVFMTDLSYFPAFNRVYETYFDVLPARIATQCAGLGGGARLELDAIAVLEETQ